MRQAGVNPTTSTRTVRDFKNFIEREKSDGGKNTDIDLLIAYGEFWEKLNRIGAWNIESQTPEEVLDIDATVILSDEEWAKLEAEFHSIYRRKF